MKNLCRLLAIGLMLAYSVQAFSSTPAERQKARPKGTTSLAFGYYEYLPSNYSSAAQLPVVIFFPGIGEKGDGTTQLPRVLKNGPPQMVVQGKDFPFILISVQHPTGWWNGTEASALVTYVKSKYKVDPYRVYVTGLSAGGFGTWTTGQTVASQLAAVVPVCGCGQKSNAANFVKLPVWAFHNSGDPTVSSTCTIDMVNAIKAAGGNPKLTIYQRNAHDAWTATYNDQNMWNWLLSQRRGSTTVNLPPIVNAGSDKVLTLPTNSITLTATSSDKDGTISSRKWTKVSGPTATMVDATTSSLKLSNLVAGTYVFRIAVTDNKSATTSDDVKVTVNNSATLTVYAGTDRTIILPTNTVTMMATSSTTSGTIVSRTWTKISGPAITIAGTTTSYLQLSKLVAGSYLFRFTAKNSAGVVKYDEAKLTVKASTARFGEEEEVVQPEISEIVAFPNPARDRFTLKLDGISEENVHIQIISGTDGRRVFEQEISSYINNSHEINISNLQAGVYLVKVKTNSGEKTIRLIKQ